MSAENSELVLSEAKQEMQKDGDLAEDDARHLQDKIQKLTDDFIAQIDKSIEAKEAELMKV